MHVRTYLLASAMFAWPAIATAQTAPEAAPAEILVTGQRVNTLNEVTRTGTRLGLTALETPATINTVSGDEIRLRGDLDLQSAVTRAPGVTLNANQGNGGTALAARGFSGQGSVLQLVDGIRLFPVAGTITFPTDPWMVERVEVLNGPASVLYGQGALGGSVNFVSRQANRERTVIEGEAGYGSQNSAHIAAGVGGPATDRLSYRFDASYRRSDGFVDRGRSRSLALAGTIRWQATDAFSVQVRETYGDQKPMRWFGTPLVDGRLDSRIRDRNYNVADAQIRYRDNQTVLTAEWTPSSAITIRNDAYRLTSKRLFKDLEYYCAVPASGVCRNGNNAGIYGFDPATPGLIFRSGNTGIIHDQEQWGDQGTARASFALSRGISNDLVVGFDVNAIDLTYSHDFASVQQYDTVAREGFAPGLFLDTVGILPRYKTRTREYAFFAEDRLKLGPAFSLVAGIRYEHDNVRRANIVYGANGSVSEVNAFPLGQTERNLQNTTYRIGGVYQPRSNISLYVQYTTGVDPLGTLTTYSTSGSQFFFTNATGNQIEAGAKATFLDGRGTATFAAYRIVKNKLVAQRTPTSPVEQIGQRSSKGLEASLGLALPAGFSIEANGTVLDARYDDFTSGGVSYKGNTPLNVPQASGNLWLRWSQGKLAAQAGLRYVGHSWSDDANTYRLPAYAVVDGGISYALTRQLALDLHVYNLFDKDYVTNAYQDEQWILGRPRSVDVTLRARF